MYFVLLILGVVGHAILWVALVNRAHGLGIHRHWVDLLTLLCVAMFAVIPLAVAAALGLFAGELRLPAYGPWTGVAWTYLALCALIFVVAAVQRWRWRRSSQSMTVANRSKRLRVADHTEGPLTAPGIATWLSRLPGNEVLSVCVQEKQLAIPRLARQHDRLRIVHLSDLHMSGRITEAYFRFVVEEVNRCRPDLVAITGDLIERDECLDWIPGTLARLEAPGGVYYVLGNHDRRVDQGRLKQTLAAAGLVYLGGAVAERTIHGLPILLAGNELPWYAPAADLRDSPPHDAEGLPLRIVLAHSPDQLGWARAHDVDLVLAGHLHGGQVCMPVLGPITAPSLHGVRYAAGTFQAGNTMLHVSRGTSALTPLRWNCPPEIAVLDI